MNERKLRRRLLVFIILGFVIYAAMPMPSVQAAKTERIRPIEDWIYSNNPSNFDPTDHFSTHTRATWDDWIRADTWSGNPFGSWKGFFDPANLKAVTLDWLAFNEMVDYDGFVLETDMPDGSLEISINLVVKGLYFEVYNIAEDWRYPTLIYAEDLVLFGKMNYQFRLAFTLQRKIPGGYIPYIDLSIEPGVREPGAELPPLYLIYYWGAIIGARYESFEFNGVGSGDFVEPGWYPPLSPTFDLWDQPELWWYIPPENTPNQSPVPTGEKGFLKLNYKELIVPNSPNFNGEWLPITNQGFDWVNVF
ncbi:MAG: hypothetical protein ACFFCP_15515 [Promethearchaeota archaeon]